MEKDAAAQSLAVNPFATNLVKQAEANYTSHGGEIIALPPDEHATFMKTLASVGADVSSKNPTLAAAYKIVTDAAARTRQSASQ